MLGFFKGKSKDNIIYSPCKGKVVPITEVSDPTFSEKVLGDGLSAWTQVVTIKTRKSI